MAGRVALLMLALFFVITQPGCWDKQETEELGIVLAQGIESAENGKVRVIYQVVNPAAQAFGTSGGKGTPYNKPYTNLAAEGDTIFEAVRKVSVLSSKRIIFDFVQVVIVSEDLARKGLRDLLDLLERDPEARRSVWLLVGRGDMASLLDEPGQLNTIPSERIRNIIQLQPLASVYAPLRLGDFYKLMESESSQPFTAVLESEPNLAFPGEEGHDELSTGNVPEVRRNLKLNGTAVFRQDKMVGWLNEKESRGLLWLRGEIKDGYLKFPGPGGTGKLFTTEILHSKTTLQPEINDGQIHMTVKIKAETYLEETREPIDVETVKRLEAAQAGTIEEEARAALDKAQREYQSDVFGFGEAVHRKYPEEWKEIKNTWPEQFSGVQVSFQVETKIRHTAMIASPAEPK
ncbi:MAG: Spore germination protein B3 precursor [Pelotomaculum sp. PtaB.Bin104]|nr:MAG: Spore germination protein B3 precursor [Pelotomaculum sp. PtaB.Bin104]